MAFFLNTITLFGVRISTDESGGERTSVASITVGHHVEKGPEALPC